MTCQVDIDNSRFTGADKQVGKLEYDRMSVLVIA
jgi:hypothetical protein